MPTLEEYCDLARRVFEQLVEQDSHCLSRSEIVAIVGDANYSIIRGALLATEKLESASGRSGGLALRRAQGNRREWGQTAEFKVRRYLQSEQAVPSDSGDIAAQCLRKIYEHWPQARIAEALSVSQGSISYWIRSGAVPNKYSQALVRLWDELKDEIDTDSEGSSGSGGRGLEESAYSNWLRAELERVGSNAVDLANLAGVHVNTVLALLDGRTETPQQRTRQRIQKAFLKLQPANGTIPSAPSPDEAGAEDTWYYIGLPWTTDEIEQVPEEAGVYIIHDRLGRPAYVGVAHKGSGGIRGRLRKHNELRWTSDRRVAHSFSYAMSGRMPSKDPSQLARSLEKLLIKFMGNAILINEKNVEDISE